MSQSRHFIKTRTRSVVSKTADLGSFGSEMKKFDQEHDNPKILNKKARAKRVVKHIKLEYDSLGGEIDESSVKLPDNFFPMYNKIKEMRELITTPVDLIGCVKIPALLKYITKRFHTSGDISNIKIEEIPKLKDQLMEIEREGFDKISRFHLLVTLLFSSQTKDEVNFQVMESLHVYYLQNGYKDGLCIESVLKTDEKEIDKMIFKIGFHSRKAAYLKETALTLHDIYDDDVPDNIEQLVKLKGIGYKMGHLILQGAWNKVVGISVDTHMVRLCNMFGWVNKNEKNPDNVRKELEKMLVNHKELWNEINPVLVGFGQTICTPTGRRCDLCLLSTINEKNDVTCPAVDKRLLLRVKRGVEKEDRKIRGDLEELIKYRNH